MPSDSHENNSPFNHILQTGGDYKLAASLSDAKP
jgi:hypothetical protein